MEGVQVIGGSLLLNRKQFGILVSPSSSSCVSYFLLSTCWHTFKPEQNIGTAA